jgi:MFS family permease
MSSTYRHPELVSGSRNPSFEILSQAQDDRTTGSAFIAGMLPYLLWLIVSIFYAYQYILRVLPNIILEDIMRNFNIDAAIFGQFSGVYYLGYVLVHLPLGMMLDRYGPKKIMTISILVSALSLLPLIFASHWIYLIISRIILGIGSSAAILGIFKIIRLNFSEQYFTRMLSLSVTIGLIGAIYGGGPVSYLCDSFGYKIILQILTGAGFILAAFTYIAIPQIPRADAPSDIIADLKTALTNRKVIFLSFCAGLMVGPLEGFADVWGAEYLKQVYDIDHTKSSYISSMIFIGMCFGSPILSLVGEKTGRYITTIIGAGVVMAMIFAMLLAKLLSVNTIIICFILVGICSSYQILAIYLASTYANPRFTGITTAITNMIIMSFGYGFHSAIGFIINIYKNTDLETAFTYGIGIIPLALLVGITGLIWFAVSSNTGVTTQRTPARTRGV